MTGARHTDYFGTTKNPCPWWCDQPQGHGYDSTDDRGQPTRLHSCEVGSVDGPAQTELPVYVEGLETLTVDLDGVSVAMGVLACSAPDARVLAPAVARRLGVLLVRAAELMNRIDRYAADD